MAFNQQQHVLSQFTVNIPVLAKHDGSTATLLTLSDNVEMLGLTLIQMTDTLPHFSLMKVHSLVLILYLNS